MLNTELFDKILLDQMDQVKLMNRTDTKYWFHYNQLQELLLSIIDNYYLLHIDGQAKLPYTTTYYDTQKNQMYNEHHNGKLNRYKIRRRSYVSSKISFLEIKFKSNKGRTIKSRIPSEFGSIEFNQKEDEFLSKYSPYHSNELQPSLINEFSRLTLVNKNFKERCTIDLNLKFQKADKQIDLDNMVIVEIKSEGSASASPLAKALRNYRIKTAGFSKYCVGRTITDTEIKRNAFKSKIRSIEKTLQLNKNLYPIN